MTGQFPTGTVTFLFTDIEGSTKLAREYPEEMLALLARHHELLRRAVQTHDGYVFQTVGDSFAVAFHAAGDALMAAYEAQRLLHEEVWAPAAIRARMGIHTGAALLNDAAAPIVYSPYATLASTQRIMSAGHGGQVLISATTQELVRDNLPRDVSLRDLGERRLKDLVGPQHIYQLIMPGLPAEFPPLKTLEAYRHNLPMQLSSFIGREKEIAEIRQSVLTHRLVTLTGVGGTGKTRLALQVAADLLDQFPDGVWFANLAPISDPDLIPRAILSAMDIPEHPGVTAWQLLMDYVRERNLLLIMDNCEHLIEACAKLADAALRHAPGVSVLATSREALGIQGELTRPVPSLTMPDVKELPAAGQLSQYESVELFVERATLVQPHFRLTDQNSRSVAEICFRLDGIPLALELAAARARALDIDVIAKRLDDRFRLLTGGSRTALERHQTLRATIDWSYNLLSAEERLLFSRLSLFVGGWTLEAAEQACVLDGETLDVLNLLTQLVDKSLAILDGPRYRMLETTRQYASEKLLESEDVEKLRDRFLTYFLDLAEEADPQLRGPHLIEWLGRLVPEIDNLRAALEWAIGTGQTHTALQMTIRVSWFWSIRSEHSEALGWLERVLALPDTPQFPALRAYALTQLAIHIYLQIGPRAARPAVEQALAIARPQGDKWNIARGLGLLGLLLGIEQDYERAKVALAESMAFFREVQDEWSYAVDLMWLGWGAYKNDDAAAALSLNEQALAEFRRLGDRYFECVTLGGIGSVLTKQGDWAGALVALRESLILSRRLGSKFESAYRLWRLAEVAQGAGHSARAVRLYWACKSALHSVGAWNADEEADFERRISACRSVMDEREFIDAVELGRTMSLDQAIELAMSDEP
jgi:predicted ATPase/class 3 adenylate cyclase